MLSPELQHRAWAIIWIAAGVSALLSLMCGYPVQELTTTLAGPFRVLTFVVAGYFLIGGLRKMAGEFTDGSDPWYVTPIGFVLCILGLVVINALSLQGGQHRKNLLWDDNWPLSAWFFMGMAVQFLWLAALDRPAPIDYANKRTRPPLLKPLITNLLRPWGSKRHAPNQTGITNRRER